MGDAVQNTIRGIFAQLEIVFGRVRAGDLQSLYTPEEWLNLAVTAAGFALAGALVGMVLGHKRRPRASGADPQPKKKKEAPPSEMDRGAHAREKYRALLSRKQLPAADMDVRVAEFQPTFDAARDRLQALGIDETSAAILFAEARDALQDGEYRRVVNLVCLAADKCAEESRDRRTAAQRCARTAIVARALAGELELASLSTPPRPSFSAKPRPARPKVTRTSSPPSSRSRERRRISGAITKRPWRRSNAPLRSSKGSSAPTMPTWRRR